MEKTEYEIITDEMMALRDDAQREVLQRFLRQARANMAAATSFWA